MIYKNPGGIQHSIPTSATSQEITFEEITSSTLFKILTNLEVKRWKTRSYNHHVK